MNEDLQRICELLEGLSEDVLNATSEDRLFNEYQNWQWPALNRHMLAAIPKNLSDLIKGHHREGTDTSIEDNLEYIETSIGHLKNPIVTYMFNGNGLAAIPVYISSLEGIRSIFEPLSGWQNLTDNRAMPTQLIKRLKSIQAQIDSLTPDKEKLENDIKLIQDATQAAYNLPTDMAALNEARVKIDKFTTDSAALFGKIESYNNQAEDLIKLLNINSDSTINSLNEKNIEADKIVQKCDEAYRTATSTGLAAAFDERAKSSSNAVIAWVICLVTALSIGVWFGSQRITLLSTLINTREPQWGIIWLNIVLSIFSVGGPIWFAWLSTKQINQRFRLSEDYAFKASVARAYEGYRREAVRIDPLFEARLFSSALTRLEEAPLRFINDEIHGSPWHELFASKPFQEALKTVPEFKNTITDLLKDKIPTLNKSVINDIKTTVSEDE